MKVNEIRELDVSAIKSKLKENLESMQNLRFQQALQQLDNPDMIKKTRREIAQIKTILNEIKNSETSIKSK
tara:strand:- start:210 stop:422 length:213 start_codon:yes stop_codon:yes gene_type:complete